MTARTDDTLRLAFESAMRRFGHRRDVTGIDIGLKITAGEYTPTVAIRMHVLRKRALRSLPRWRRFPKRIKGVPVDVISARYEDQNTALQRMVTPVRPGVSIGRVGSGTGTLGLLVTDNRRGGKLGFVTAAHVLLEGGGSAGDIVLQPSPADGGTSANEVGTVSRADLRSDSILAILAPGRAADAATALTSVRFSAPRDPVLDEVLAKVGRTTGARMGRVEAVFGQYMGLGDAFRLVGLDGTPIAESGDSGAVWYDPNSGAAVGLHCKGPAAPGSGANYAVAVRLSVAFRRLAVTLA